VEEDPYGRDPRRVRFWGWVTVAAMFATLVIVLLIDHPWTKCHC
jgi:hypothetical protein